MDTYYQNRSSVRETYRVLRLFYGRHNRPSNQAFYSLINKFRITHSLHDVRPPSRLKYVRNREAIQPPKPSIYWKENLVTTLFQKKWFCQLASKIVWFDASRLFFCGYVKFMIYANKPTNLHGSIGGQY